MAEKTVPKPGLPEPTLFADRLRVLRAQNRALTQQAVADAIGVPKTTYQNWEADKAMPKMKYVAELAAFYNLSVAEFLGFETRDVTSEIVKKLDTMKPESRQAVLTLINLLAEKDAN